jgi:hypothetical protein
MAVSDERPLRDWHFKQLRWSLRALAAAGSHQRTLFPDHAPTADELAFDFEHWAGIIRSEYEGELSRPQADSLAAIDRKLATMSRHGVEFDLELWTDSALSGSEHWADVRGLAATALEAFGWAVDTAPENPDDQSAISR